MLEGEVVECRELHTVMEVLRTKPRRMRRSGQRSVVGSWRGRLVRERRRWRRSGLGRARTRLLGHAMLRVRVVVLVGVRTRHGLRSRVRTVVVSRKRGEATGRVRVVTVRVGAICVSAGETEVMRRNRVFTLDLRGSSGQEVDVHGVVETSRAKVAAHVARQVRARVTCVGAGVRVRGRNVGRRKLRIGC